MHFILITTALLLIYINYEFIHEQERMKQEVQVVMKEYSDKIAAAKKDSNFVLLQDPLISAPICAMINKFDNPISTKPVKPIVKHVIHKKRNR
jgi:esterase/lipase